MKTNKRPIKKIIIASIVIISVLVGGGLIWNSRRNNNTADTTTNPGSTQKKPSTSSSTGDIKQEIIDKEEQSNQTPAETSSGKKKVTPVITSASQLTVSAYVPGVFEEGGKCTATLTQGSATVSKNSDGFGNVSYTQCAPIDLSTLNFPSKGTWSLTVNYASATAEGASNSQNIEVN